jgi:hypothetical protein
MRGSASSCGTDTSMHHVRRGQHRTRRDQVPRPERLVITRPALDREPSHPPDSAATLFTPSANQGFSVPLPPRGLQSAELRLSHQAHGSLGIDGREHQLDLLDRLSGHPGIRTRLDDPEPDLRSRRSFPARPTVALRDTCTEPSSNRTCSP